MTLCFVLSSHHVLPCKQLRTERLREAVQTDSESVVTAGEVQQLSMTKYDYEGECYYK